MHTEKTFETEIVAHLVANGYVEGKPTNFDKDLCLDTVILLDFIKTSQPKQWAALCHSYKQDVEAKFLRNLYRELDLNGMLHVIRNGFTDIGVKFYLYFRKPETTLNQTALENYQQNIISVTRQVRYSKKSEKSIDLVLFINGLPVVSAELKNHFTNQSVADAIQQYKETREPNELLFTFQKRTIVHFAVDSDQVYLTTKLDNDNTKFLPFNKGYKNGAGNPLNENGHKTAYLWEEVWQKDSLFEIIEKFVIIERKTFTDKSTKKTAKKITVVFPRYHQLSAVRNLLSDVKQKGVGLNYLVQHSAGSGKSNTIAWLSYRLSSIVDAKNQKMFSSVIVITDRKVLDTQLQDTIFNIDHVNGIVQKIDEDSKQLAKALKSGKHIIITTLQKFPFILEQAKDFPANRYAVIIDEAHSSQSGDAHSKMKKALSSSPNQATSQTDDEDTDGMEYATNIEIKQPNISFFAFTATPKAKTLSIFGTKGTDDKPRAFHLYPMRQAIEEGFILDVLKNYTTYEVYWKLQKTVAEDPELDTKRGRRAIGKYIALDSYNISQKTDIILDHFEKVARHQIGGLAKAMLVTSSRLQAFRYFEEFKRQIVEKKYTEIRALIAFSGTLQDDIYCATEVTEASLNGFPEKELPERFETEYNILLVAEKYQTGFDQPLLQTMYIDKQLSGVKAVQTLSRLNRMAAGKSETFVLDFVNTYDIIKESFQPYYEVTTLTENPNPNLLYDLKNRIYESQVVWLSEVEAFGKIYFKHSGKLSNKEHAQLAKFIDPAAERFFAIVEEEKQDDLKNTFSAYLSMFTFLSQLIPYEDAELEMLYPYIRFLLTKINTADSKKPAIELYDKIALEYYRIQKVAEGNVLLEAKQEGELQPPTEVGLSRDKEDRALLSKIIDILNHHHQTDFTPADALTFEQYEMDLESNEDLKQQAQNNSFDNFMYGFEDKFLDMLIKRMDINRDIFDKIMEDDKGFGKTVKKYLAKRFYEKFSKK